MDQTDIRGTWNEQFERVKRSYATFKEITDGRTHDRDSEYYIDSVLAFFQNSYHLKDWLKNDPSSGPHVKDVESMINQSTFLSLCADICNGSKHLGRDRDIRSSSEPEWGPRLFKLNVSAKEIAIDLPIKVGPETFQAFDVATQCMKEWESYLAEKGLLQPAA